MKSIISIPPTFGTTTNQYHYNKDGLLISSNWKYVTEKEKIVQSTGKVIYSYTDWSKKPKSTTKTN